MAGDTVLVVEDDAGMLDFVVESLEGEGYYAVTVPDPAAALRVMGALLVDLVLLDHGPDPAPARALIRAARAAPGGARVLLWTAWHDGAERAAAIGADGAVEKPIDLDALLARVRAEVGAP